MLSPEDTDNQKVVIAAYRRTLAHLLEQAAQFSLGFVPAHIANGIDDARANIARIKADLSAVGQPIDDQPNDQSPASAVSPAQPTALPLDTVPSIAALPHGSRMLLSPNPLFVGREADLLRLAHALATGATAAIGPTAAATGLGGIGKTQLAVEFAYRYGQYFAHGVFWLSFADPAAVPAEVAACGSAGALELPTGFQALPVDEQVQLVLAEWRRAKPRLLIFDNCEDERLLDQWRPSHGGCHVLITSRRASWDATFGVAALPLDVLPRAQSIELLRKHRPDLSKDDADLAAIADVLGDLPLALHLASSFLSRYRHAVSPSQYLAQISRPAMLQHRSLQVDGHSPTGYELHVARTFALSYERLDAATPTDALAIQLLARAAYFAAGEPIPRELLRQTVELPDDDAVLQLEDSLARLLELGLIDQTEDGSVRLHRLLILFVQELATASDGRIATEQAILETTSRLNEDGIPAPLLQLQRHLRAVTDAARVREDQRAAGLCNNLGYHLRMIGDLAGARPYLERALTIRRRLLGDEHTDTAQSLNNLGRLLQEQGDLTGARSYYERALAIRERVLGADHPSTASTLNNLGSLLQDQGNLTAARVYIQRALAIRERVLGADHPSTASSLNNLGNLLQTQGDLTGARGYIEQALAIRQRVLGEEHPSTAVSLNNLGRLLKNQGDLTAARGCHERALAIRQRVLGEDHPSTAVSLHNLGSVLYDQGDLPGARGYYEQALVIRQRVLGEDHPHTASSLHNLGRLLQQQGDLTGARPYYERTLAIRQRVLGEEHPDTANCLSNLGMLLYAQGDLASARPYLERALAIVERVLGDDHRYTRMVRANMAALDQAVAAEHQGGTGQG